MGSYGDNYPFLYIYLQQNLSHVSEVRQGWAAELGAVNRRYEVAVQAIVQQGVDDAMLRSVRDARGGCDCSRSPASPTGSGGWTP